MSAAPAGGNLIAWKSWENQGGRSAHDTAPEEVKTERSKDEGEPIHWFLADL
jgi:hypothetical protein